MYLLWNLILLIDYNLFQKHNEIRSQVALGQYAVDDDYLPPADNMVKLVSFGNSMGLLRLPRSSGTRKLSGPTQKMSGATLKVPSGTKKMSGAT